MASLNPKTLAKNGWFAARLRRLMKEQGLRNQDLAKRMQAVGAPSTGSTVQTNISTWVRALGLPGGMYRAPLAKALGVPEAELYAKPEDGKPQSVALVPVPVRAAKVLAPANGEDRLHVMVRQGMAELRLHVAVPVRELDRVMFGLHQLGLLE